MKRLFEKLQENAEKDIYPYHMPGHKRRSWGMLPEALYKIDITEIDGFDNLHQPEGILLELQKRAALLYGAEESFYLVNGSTCGILSAVSAAIPAGGRILMARNCHQSAYHAAYLRNLEITYLYPHYMAEYDIFDAVTPRQIREALEQEPDIEAVLIVSPTYEGRISDIGEIAHIVHEKGIPLIVDEAHGAHLGLAPGFPLNSCQLGADLVIHSVHKTLPALTQAALLHANGALVNRGLLRRFLHIYQSSSPSYLLMASMDNALEYIEQNGGEAFRKFKGLYESMMKELSKCRYLKFLPEDPAVQDVGKLLISVKNTKITGKQLYDILLQRYRLQMEMASETFVLAMFTMNDGEEAYRRMSEALLEIDSGMMGTQKSSVYKHEQENAVEQKLSLWECIGRKERQDMIPLAKAWDMEKTQEALEDSAGRYAGEFVRRYPPGIPLLVPGERITEEICAGIQKDIEEGLTVQGIEIQKCEASAEKKYYISVLQRQG